ncbi:MAG: hypothetical protein ABI852_02830 [Gemmatimonadaceae bacterium]
MLSNPKLAIGAAAVTLIVGYADLWRGGESLAPVLLTLGYVILVPIAIMALPKREAVKRK